MKKATDEATHGLARQDKAWHGIGAPDQASLTGARFLPADRRI